MKAYEKELRLALPRRSLSVLRVDGRAFHTWTRGLERPYDLEMLKAMETAALDLVQEISGSICAYTQSDEISVLFQDFLNDRTEPWFGGVVQKIASVSASIATASFIKSFPRRAPALFDARLFSLPDQVEAANYFLWRQHDARRNAISMLAEDSFSSKSLHGKSTGERRQMLTNKGIEIDKEDPRFLHGQLIYKTKTTESVQYVDRHTKETRQTPPVERHKWVSSAAESFAADPDNYLYQMIPTPVSSG
jgi:tRNA(His) guanylyltransferase